MSKVSQAPFRASSGLLASYKPLPDVADEMIDPSGAVRPGWETLLHTLDQIGPEKLATRFARANQYLLDAGVFYRVYDENGTQEREWPLAHIPILIDETEWQTITAGLTQRADLLEEIVADIYGETQTDPRRNTAAGSDCLQSGIPASDGRRKTGERPFPAFLRIRTRPWA